MATRITLKLALEQIEALRHNLNLVETERDSLRNHNLGLITAVAQLQHEVAQLKAAAPAPRTTKLAYVRPERSAEQRAAHDAYVAALMAAKDLAIKTGRSVRVGE